MEANSLGRGPSERLESIVIESPANVRTLAAGRLWASTISSGVGAFAACQ